MKYCIIVPDGMADYPQRKFTGRTPLEIARTPNMDRLAKEGELGLVQIIPKGFSPGSDVANLSLLGYDPAKYYTGRAPLEAVNLGITLGQGDWAFRCNLITADEDTLADFSAGHISQKEANILMALVNEKLGAKDIQFFPGVSYRNIMVHRGGYAFKLKTTPPHDIQGQSISKHLPRGEGAKLLCDLMEASRGLLDAHDINEVRRDLGQNPANMLWLWGEGQAPQLPKFKDRFGLTAAAISAVDLVKGIATCLGWENIAVPGATGYLDTDYAAKGRYAIEALKTHDLVFVHIEAPDEAAHEGEPEKKVRAIEHVDREIIGPMADALRASGEFRLMVLPDHFTPIQKRTHSPEPVPFVMAGTDVAAKSGLTFTEANAAKTGVLVSEGHRLMERFLRVG